jgi:hypothetical protein
MLHACVERFDVMGGRGNILGWDEEVNKAKIETDALFRCTSKVEIFSLSPSHQSLDPCMK